MDNHAALTQEEFEFAQNVIKKLSDYFSSPRM